MTFFFKNTFLLYKFKRIDKVHFFAVISPFFRRKIKIFFETSTDFLNAHKFNPLLHTDHYSVRMTKISILK